MATKMKPIYLDSNTSAKKVNKVLFDLVQNLEGQQREVVSAVIDHIDELLINGHWG